MEKELVKTTKLIFLALELAPPSSPTRYFGQSLDLPLWEKKGSREGSEVAIVGVLAGKKVGGAGGGSTTARKGSHRCYSCSDSQRHKGIFFWRGPPWIGMVLVGQKER